MVVSLVIRRRGRAEESQSIALNYEIIRTLQTEVEPRLTAHPGVYDGRKNLFTSFKLEFESDFHEASQLYHRSFPSSTFSLISSISCP
jgi:hypothetical protein